jgi:hypothetical protein
MVGLRYVMRFFQPKRKWTETKLVEEQSGLTFNHGFETNDGLSCKKGSGTGRTSIRVSRSAAAG